MKKLGMNKEMLFRCMIALYIFCLSGVFMQIISPEFPDHATFIGIMFFVMAVVLGVVIWKFRIIVRKERIAAAREQSRREREQQAD